MDYFDSLSEKEQADWQSEIIFKPVSEWDEEDGPALFFKLDAGEVPQVTNPLSSSWDANYYTHWMPLPKELSRYVHYRAACIKSGIETNME